MAVNLNWTKPFGQWSVALALTAASQVAWSQPATTDDAECRQLVEPGTSPFDISAAPDPLDDTSLPDNAVVGNITYTRLPIFDHTDPAENNFLFRLADFLHIDTQERMIRQQLLFRRGEPITERRLEESARILRDKGYLYDARIWPYQICGNRVDIEVVTREVWTLNAGFSVSRSGGSDESRIAISDNNFLGRGESLAFAYNESTDRDGFEFRYGDPNLLGSRHTLDLFYADNDDGAQTIVDIERPFYSLDARRAWGMIFNDDQREDTLYDRGEDVAAFQTQVRQSEVFFGLSPGWEDGLTERWRFGVRTHREHFEPALDEIAPVPFPIDREFNYPYVEFTSIEEDFIRATNVNQIHRIEDFNLGRSWTVSLGYADQSWDSNKDRIVYSGVIRDAWQLDSSTLVQMEVSLTGLWQTESRETEDLEFETNWRYYDGVSRNVGTFLALDLRYRKNMPANEQLLLGAEESLRGYPARYQSGDRSFRFTVERRYYTDWHLWRLLRVGGAVFFDVGRAWFPDQPNADATGLLADAGFGLRLASSRAETKRVLHIDFAFPFEHEDDIDGVQILVTAKQSF